MATRLTSPGSARRCTPSIQRKGSRFASGPRTRSFRTVLRAPVVAPRLPVLTRHSQTGSMNWGRIRPWSTRTMLLHITITVDGWEVRTCLGTARRTACRRVFCHNNTALGSHLVRVGVARLTATVGTGPALDTLSRSGQIPLPWDN